MEIEYHPFKILAEEAVNPNTPIQRLEELVSKNRRLIHLVASNSVAPPELLEKLSRRRDSGIKAKVAANPNTPIHILLKLGQDYPGEILNNSQFYLKYIAPNLPLEIPSKILAKLIHYDGELLKTKEDYNGLIGVAFLLKSSTSKSVNVRCCVAFHLKTPSEVLEKLSNDKSSNVRFSVAGNPKSPITILKKLSCDEDYYVRSNVAKNLHTPNDILDKLSNDTNSYVRMAVVSHPDISVKTLEKLARDTDNYIKAKVASNHKISIDLLEILSLDDGIVVGESIKGIVASNPNTPVSILERLSQDNGKYSYYFHKNIISNSKTPSSIIEMLVEKHIQYLESSRKEYSREEYEIKYFFPLVLANPNTSIHVIERLAKIPDWRLRKNIASSENTPESILDQLIKDESVDVHIAIASNLKTPAHILEKMANIENQEWRILREIANNPNTPIQILQKMSKDHRKSIRGNAIANLARRGLSSS